MADRTVTVRISAQDSFSSVIAKYNAQMGQAEQQTKRLGNASRETGGVLGNLGRDMAGFITAIGVQQIASVIGDITELGYQARATEATFTALIGTSDEFTGALEQMRDATGGVVNDMTLMASASRFVQMGLASTADEASRLAEMAVKLGGAMGRDANTALEEFSLLLANQSILRLDTFGISAARVREQIEQLKAAGLDASEAFRLAVLDEGTEALERLGDAADVSSTALARLQTMASNAGATFATNFTAGVEGIALGIENIDAVFSSASQEWWWPLISGANPTLGALAGASEMSVEARTAADAARRRRAPGEALASSWMTPPPSMADFATYQGAFNTTQLSNSADANMADLFNLMGQASSIQMGSGDNFPAFFTQEEAQQAELIANRAENIYEFIEAAHETGVVSDESMQRAEGMLETTKQITDQIQESAEALSRMSLSQMMGQSGGGRSGELGDMVLGGLDVPENEMSALRDAMDLASGRQTELSQTVRDELVPLLQQIATEEGPDALAEAVTAFENAMTERTRQGDTPMDINTWLEGILGGGSLGRSSGRGTSEGASMDSGAFITALEGGAGSMVTISENSTLFKENMGEIFPAVESIHGMMPDIETGMSGVAGKAEVLAGFMTTTHDLLSQMVENVQVVRMDIRPTAPQWLIALASGAGQSAGAFMAQIVNANGGVVPGAVDR